MTKKYIVLESGVPLAVNELPGFMATRLGVMAKFWECNSAYDEYGLYKQIVSDPPQINTIQRFLAHLCYNPMMTVNGKWEKVGEYSKSNLIATVSKALETDDDIIQQWFEGPQVMKLMEESKTFEEMFKAVQAICGEHETDKEVLAYVEKVLGKQIDEES